MYDADAAACGDAAGQAPAQQGQAQQQQKTALQLRQARKTERRKPRRLAQKAARLQAAGSNPPSSAAAAEGAAASAPPAEAARLAAQAPLPPRPDAGLAESEAQLARMAAECVALRQRLDTLTQGGAASRQQLQAELAASSNKLTAAQEGHLGAMRAIAQRGQRQPLHQLQLSLPPLSPAKKKAKVKLPPLKQLSELRQALDTFLELGGLRYLGSCVPEYMLVSRRGGGGGASNAGATSACCCTC